MLRGTLTLIAMISIFNIGLSEVSAIENPFINYYGIEITEIEYNNLLNLGFTDKEIYYMDKDTYLDNKDYNAVLLVSNKKYYKTVVPYYGVSYTTEVTYDDYLNYEYGNGLRDWSQTYFQEFETTISYKNADKYRYKITTNWLNMPANFSYDVIGIGFQDDVYISSTVFFKHMWTLSDSTEGQSTGVYDRKSTSIGGSVTYQLPSGNVVGMGATLYYDVSKETNDTITYLEVCGDYAHSLSPVTGTQASNYVMSYGGIGFDSTVGPYFNQIPCTYASIYGISW